MQGANTNANSNGPKWQRMKIDYDSVLCVLFLFCCFCFRCFWCSHLAVVFAHWHRLTQINLSNQGVSDAVHGWQPGGGAAEPLLRKHWVWEGHSRVCGAQVSLSCNLGCSSLICCRCSLILNGSDITPPLQRLGVRGGNLDWSQLAGYPTNVPEVSPGLALQMGKSTTRAGDNKETIASSQEN